MHEPIFVTRPLSNSVVSGQYVFNSPTFIVIASILGLGFNVSTPTFTYKVVVSQKPAALQIAIQNVSIPEERPVTTIHFFIVSNRISTLLKLDGVQNLINERGEPNNSDESGQ